MAEKLSRRLQAAALADTIATELALAAWKLRRQRRGRRVAALLLQQARYHRTQSLRLCAGAVTSSEFWNASETVIAFYCEHVAANPKRG